MATSVTDLNLPGLRTYEPATSSAPKALDGKSTQDLQSNFLQMLTVQLRNQDPLNPMESNEMTSQLAQLNMVDGIATMNKTMSAMITQMQNSDFMSQSAMVGRSAMSAAQAMQFDGDNPVVLAANFTKPVTDVVMKIRDSSGNLVLNKNLGQMPAGISNLLWDGLNGSNQEVPAGRYLLEITGKDGEANVAAQTLVASAVATVGRNGNDAVMTLADGRKIAPKDVVQWVMN
jgi:flagellar basal-body rod modification protein FlgD